MQIGAVRVTDRGNTRLKQSYSGVATRLWLVGYGFDAALTRRPRARVLSTLDSRLSETIVRHRLGPTLSLALGLALGLSSASASSGGGGRKWFGRCGRCRCGCRVQSESAAECDDADDEYCSREQRVDAHRAGPLLKTHPPRPSHQIVQILLSSIRVHRNDPVSRGRERDACVVKLTKRIG